MKPYHVLRLYDVDHFSQTARSTVRHIPHWPAWATSHEISELNWRIPQARTGIQGTRVPSQLTQYHNEKGHTDNHVMGYRSLPWARGVCRGVFCTRVIIQNPAEHQERKQLIGVGEQSAIHGQSRLILRTISRYNLSCAHLSIFCFQSTRLNTPVS